MKRERETSGKPLGSKSNWKLLVGDKFNVIPDESILIGFFSGELLEFPLHLNLY
jgi:hypothetical protein